MIEVRCPGCAALLRVRDELRGKTGACPKCKSRVHIPAPSPGFDVVDDDEDVPVVRPKARVAKPKGQPLLPPPPPKGRDDDDDDRPRRKKRRKRQREYSSDNVMTIATIGCAALGLVFALLGLAHPGFLTVSILIGVIMCAVGDIWVIVIAFQEDAMCGCLCLLFAPYSLYYVVTRWDETMRPFLLYLAGFLLLVGSAVCAGAVVLKNPNGFNGGNFMLQDE